MLMLSAFILFLGSVLHCSARDTITGNPGDWLRNDGETLVSSGKTFELGFFDPHGSGVGRYVGIWYYRSEPPIVVWVANRYTPLPLSGAPSGVFAVKEDGGLKVLDGNGSSYWSSRIKTSAGGRVVMKLMDSGNLVLRDQASTKILWESFKNPTDTFLPGMTMDETLALTSWVSPEDPATGSYTFKLDEGSDGDQYITYRNSIVRYWSSKESEGTPDEMTDAVLCLLSGSREASCRHPAAPKFKNDSKFLRVPFSRHGGTRRLVMSFSGEIQYYLNPNMSSPNWRAPQDRCSVSKACGKFGSCNVNNAVMCKCLPGFRPTSPDRWNDGDFSGGCTRNSPICEKKNGQGDGFLSLEMMEVRKRDSSVPVAPGDADYCRKTCLSTCECLAYAETYDRTPQCLFWMDRLTDLQEECPYGAMNLSVRVALSDIKPTGRTCKTCGTNMVPYPLSTGPNCGDPMYSKFKCGIATGQLHFVLPVGHYRVTSTNPEELTFGIQLKNADCNSRDKIPSLEPPFRLASTDACQEVRIDNSGSEMPLANNSIVVKISWEPPPEPVCTSSADCEDWQHSSCRGRSGMRRCFCNKGFRWNSSSLSCVEESAIPAGNNRKWPLSSPAVVIGITVAVALAVALGITAFYVVYLRKRIIARRKKERRSLQLYDSGSRVKQLIDSEEFKEEDKEGIDVPLFDIEDILVATDNFSYANRLGRGGFGTVYKGKFPEGQDIAVKRLSRASGQGLQEFKNEVVLIAKLQHRNLVRLLGYCVEGDEKILVYEYLPNKSLDYFIFDHNRCKLLNWENRFDIILGIARGLVYLHQDSRLKIIHRDLKTSNVLLDDDMNPKISDFGLARIFDSKQVEANTNRVVGTYGYMSPEYALEGLFSEKSDVFSFGVMVIEIISGKRSTGFYQSESDQIFSLTGHAWKLWQEEKVLEMMDQTLKETCGKNEVMRCMNVGLLCVQEDPKDRPTMAVALVMLSSETHVEMPLPKQPAFAVKRDFSVTASSSSSSSSASSKHEPSRDLEMKMLTSIEEGR